MPKRLLLLVDVLLVIAVGALGVHLYRVWTAVPPKARADTPAAATAGSPGAVPAPAAPSAPGAFTIVAERNLFSPTRSEVAPEPPKAPGPTTAAAPPAPKPRLYGVVLRPEGNAQAYLEDPRTRKVFGYKIGDSVADSRVEQISVDRVVLRRGSEVFEVLLRDPTKPKPPPSLTVPGAPGTPGAPFPGVPVTPPAAPGQVPGAVVPGVPGAAAATPGTPQVQVPGQPPLTPPRVIPQSPPGRPVVPGRPPVRTPGAPSVSEEPGS